MKFTVENAIAAIKPGYAGIRLIERQNFDVRLYAPVGTDAQKPHARDELYVIARGTGRFICQDETEDFCEGDAFFVPGGVEHRFVDFSSDFATWVIFFGEAPAA
ncbi:MAG TPA: cupin domain-containing protein [Rhizomicrobium sp.]